jgi:hypothetical protein
VKTTFCFLVGHIPTQSCSGRFGFAGLPNINNPLFSTHSFFQYCIVTPIKTVSSQLQDCRITISLILRKRCLDTHFPLGKRLYSRWDRYFFPSILYTVISNTSPLQYPVGVYMKNYEKPTNLINAYQIGFLL